jgi:hypothetical protein
MAHDGRWTSGQWVGASHRRVAGLTTGNPPAMTHGCGAEGGLGEDGPDRWAPSASDYGARNGMGAGSRAKMGRVRCRAGPTAEKMAHNDFFSF